MQDSTIKCLVSGRVQGVFFRASARTKALELGLSGYAKNLTDGSVEVVARGAQEKLISFRQWLNHGPPHAHVISIRCESVPSYSASGFAVL